LDIVQLMAHPPLTVIQRRVLHTDRWAPEVDGVAHRARGNHTTLSYLRALGLVISEPVHRFFRDRPTGMQRWRVTSLGLEVLDAPAGTPVPMPLLSQSNTVARHPTEKGGELAPAALPASTSPGCLQGVEQLSPPPGNAARGAHPIGHRRHEDA
jgi:hypothetical protein